MIIVFAGSKGGAGRTTASVALAFGLSLVDRGASHIQVLDGRHPPIFDGTDGLPFQVASVQPADMASVAPLCASLAEATPRRIHVVDLPAGRPTFLRSLGPQVRVVIPYREGELDREAAANDVLDLSGGEDVPEAFQGFALLPVASAVLSLDELRLGFDGMGLPCGPGLPLPILAPGMRRLSVPSMQSLTSGARFKPDKEVTAASQDLRYAVMQWIGARGPPYTE